MKEFLGKAIKIFDIKSNQGYQPSIISWFAESLTLNPAVLSSPYVTYEEINEIDTPVGLRCEYEDYRESQGILRAHTVRSIKIFPEKELVYFESNHIQVEYIK